MNTNLFANEATIPTWKFEITSWGEDAVLTPSVVVTPSVTSAVKLPSSWAWDVLLVSAVLLSTLAALAVKRVRSAF